MSQSGYYKWLKTADEPDTDYDDYLLIKEVFDKRKGTYGWRRMKMELPHMNHKKIQRIMKKFGMVTKIRRKNPYKKIMKQSLEHRTAPNILQRAFQQDIPLTVLCTDITYIPLCNDFAYLSVIKDIASGEILAWNLSLGLHMNIVLDTMNKIQAPLLEGSIIHSDQGFHYTNPKFIQTVLALNITQSMSRKGNCIDNAPIESFFGHMKDELEYEKCTSYKELYLAIENYMRYYNHERKQWNRNRMTPVQYREYLFSLSGGVGVGF